MRAPRGSEPGGAKDPYDQLVRLGLEQGRVIGCLIEKQLTTPQQYPLSLNALVTACNQTSNATQWFATTMAACSGHWRR